MLKFGASQHFQEVSHEPPGTERGEKFVGDEGDDECRGGGVVRVVVCVCVCVCTCGNLCVSMCARARSVERSRGDVDVEVAVLEWRDGWMSWVEHGDVDTELL